MQCLFLSSFFCYNTKGGDNVETRMERNKELHKKVNEMNKQYDLYLQNPDHIKNKTNLYSVDPAFFSTSSIEKTSENHPKKEKKKMIVWGSLIALGVIVLILIICLVMK